MTKKHKVHPGISNQIKQCTIINYNDLTIKKIDEILFEINNSIVKQNDK